MDNTQEGGPERTFTELWSMPGSFERVLHATLLDDTIYVAGAPRGLFAIDTDSGLPRWKHIGKRVVDHPPTVRRDTVWFLEGGQFVGIDKTSGKELSRARSRVGSATPVYPGEGVLMVAGGDDYAYGVNPESGYKLWKATVGDYVTKSTWDGQDRVFMVRPDGTLTAFSVGTRQVAWSHEFSRDGLGMPYYANEVLYIGSNDFHFYALDSASGTTKWRISLSAHVTGTPSVAHGRVYVSTAERILYAIDTETHKVLWKLDDADQALTATKTHVIILRKTDGPSVLAVVDAANGRLISQHVMRRYEHFVGDAEAGILYALTRSGDVLALAHRSAQKAGVEE